MVIGLTNKTKSKNISDYVSNGHYKVIRIGDIVDRFLTTCEYENMVLNMFGPSILNEDDSLNKEKLKNMLDSNLEYANDYNNVILNYIYSIVDEILAQDNQKNFIIEWDMLDKSKYFYQCDKNILFDLGSNNDDTSYDFVINENSLNIEEELQKLQDKLKKFSCQQIVGLFAGSFDPFHLGHLDIVRNAAKHCDKLYVGIGNNPNKIRTFDKNEMKAAIEKTLLEAGLTNCEVVIYDGLTIDFAKENGVNVLIRGYRNGANLSEEKEIARYNREHGNIGSYLIPNINKLALSSTYIRNLIKKDQDISRFVPQPVSDIVYNMISVSNKSR